MQGLRCFLRVAAVTLLSSLVLYSTLSNPDVDSRAGAAARRLQQAHTRSHEPLDPALQPALPAVFRKKVTDYVMHQKQEDLAEKAEAEQAPEQVDPRAADAILQLRPPKHRPATMEASLAADEIMSSNCGGSCAVFGTCYEPLKRCDCPWGREGSDCSKPSPQQPEPCPSQLDPSLGPEHEAFYHHCQQMGFTPGDHGPFCTMGKKGVECACQLGWEGRDCMRANPTYCMGGCSCYGECVAGFCKCQPGYFGVDCSLSTDLLTGQTVRTQCYRKGVGYDNKVKQVVEVPETAEGDLPDPLIYVYELPPQYNTHLVSKQGPGWVVDPKDRSAHPSIYPGEGYVGPPELFLWERLLASKHRTLDPEKADYFFIPALSRPGGGGFAGSSGRYGGGALHYWRDVIHYVSHTWPYWNRNGGRDHIIAKMGDHGACESPRGRPIPEDIRPAILLSNWGLWTDTTELTNRSTWPYHDRGPCFRPGQDIIIPAPQQHSVRDSPAMFKKNPAPLRRNLFFFAGTRVWGGQEGFYSHNVRDKIFELYEGRDGFDIRRRASNFDMALSVFCLAPSGLGFGDRLFLNIAYGCIPVVIQDNVTQAWEEDLPYSLFAVRVAEADIPRLDTILGRFDEDQIRAMQAALKCVMYRFTWGSIYGTVGDDETGHDDGFDTLMMVLRNRKYYPGQTPPSAKISSVDELCSTLAPPKDAPPTCKAWSDASVVHGSYTTCRSDDCCPHLAAQPRSQPWPPYGALRT